MVSKTQIIGVDGGTPRCDLSICPTYRGVAHSREAEQLLFATRRQNAVTATPQFRTITDFNRGDEVRSGSPAAFSKGFRGGGVIPRPFDMSQVRAFEAETLRNYESSIKDLFFDRRLLLYANGFFETYDDIQESITTGYGTLPISAIPLNVGKAELKGAELEFDAPATTSLGFDGSVSYREFKFTDVAASALATGITLDMVPAYSPEWKGSSGAQYEIPLSAYGSLTPRIDMTSQSSMYANPVNATLELSLRLHGVQRATRRAPYG